MKRYLVVAVALVLVVSLGLALTGCGGDTGKAKEYINNAGVIIEEVEGESSEMEAQIETIFTELESGEVNSSARADELAKGLADASDDLISKANEAKLELEKVASLEGVDEYQEYALLRISVIDNITEFIQSTEKYLNDFSKTLAAGEAGQPIDKEKFIQVDFRTFT